jgi:hypothetical protein
MSRHLFCLTVDTDPDGLNARPPDRRSMAWDGLIEAQQNLPQDLADLSTSMDAKLPLTWFIRVDGQLQTNYGTPLYLLERFDDFWCRSLKWGHELGWHPHLYRQSDPENEPIFISDAGEASEELERLWLKIKSSPFTPTAFRNGEGWHSKETFAAVEKLGLLCDSTAIPGRRGGDQHPMNWLGAPNQPYFPDRTDLRVSGPARALLEIPMNTWRVCAPYDESPQIRYMNPAIHGELFSNSLDEWQKTISLMDGGLHVWVLIFHPDEIMPNRETDLLYAHSRQALCRNVAAMIERVKRVGHGLEFVTLSAAAQEWKRDNGASA